MQDNWQPPEDYIPVASTVEGITVFAPRPKEDSTAAPKTFQCPQCGASTRYDVAAGGVACEHCGYVAPVQAQTVGARASESEFTLETLKQASEAAEQGWGVARKELHCEACGADMALAPGALTATCPFCASNRVNVREAASDQLRPRFLVPFKVQPETTKARVREWLGTGWFHPPELQSSALVDNFAGVYLPFWTFDAHITSDWRAEVGYPHTETYYDASSKTHRTRTVIRWRWENGRVTLKVDDLLIPGTSRVSRVILEKLTPFSMGELAAYTPDYLAGWQAQAYDIALPKAWEAGKAEMRERAKDACRQDIPSSHVRNFSMTADFAGEVWRYILLPVYVAAYRFENKAFQVMVNGQTGAVAGQKPVAWWKIYAAIAAALSPGLCLALIGLPLLLAGGVGAIPLALGAVLFVLGVVGAVWVYRQAVASEAA